MLKAMLWMPPISVQTTKFHAFVPEKKFGAKIGTKMMLSPKNRLSSNGTELMSLLEIFCNEIKTFTTQASETLETVWAF